MIIIHGILIIYTGLPILGELYALFISNSFIVSAGIVSPELIINNLIFFSIFIFIIFSFTRKKTEFNLQIYNPKRLLFRLFIVSIFIYIFVFYFSGYDFLFQSVNRGYLRINMGLFGPLYTWVINYLNPILLALSYLAYSQLESNLKNKSLFYFIFLFTSISAIFTGYKADIVLQMIPFLILYFLVKKRSLFKIIKISFTFSFILTLTTMLVMNMPFVESFIFIMNRLTSMTAYGAIGVYNEFPYGSTFNDFVMLILGGFGNKITSFVLNVEYSSLEMISTNLSRLITFLVYPNKLGALSGTVNVTVTSFGESIYILGKYFYWIYAVIGGLFVSWVINKFKSAINKGKVISYVMFITYIHSVILPWLNSGGFVSLFSFTTLVYLLATYLFLIFIYKTRLVY